MKKQEGDEFVWTRYIRRQILKFMQANMGSQCSSRRVGVTSRGDKFLTSLIYSTMNGKWLEGGCGEAIEDRVAIIKSRDDQLRLASFFLSPFAQYLSGASIPSEAMMHFPSVSDFPYFRKISRTPLKIFTIWPSPNKFLDFHLPKFQFISPRVSQQNVFQ